jgi:hypothetical protein
MKQTITVDINQAAPGMELADDLVNPASDLVLRAGTILTQNTISFAKKKIGDGNIKVVVKSAEQPAQLNTPETGIMAVQGEFESNIDKALSMILHYDEVAQIAEIIKKVYRDRMANRGA